MTNSQTLSGVTVVNLAINVPGPYAAARLHEMGAEVIKVEPPTGDTLNLIAPKWYSDLAQGMTVETVDLKSPEGLSRIHDLLAEADVFITSHRRATLKKLGLYDAHLDHPRLCHIEIVGDVENPDVPGHDLTYQAAAGILEPPNNPKILAGDITGSEQAVSAALALLLRRTTTGEGGRTTVGLRQGAEESAGPLQHGLTAPDGILGGAVPGYGLYQAADGWVAVAALEPHFAAGLASAAGNGDGDIDVATSREPLEQFFSDKTLAELSEWAAEHQLPITPVLDGPRVH